MTKSSWLAGNTYDVLTKTGSQWIINAPCDKKYAALELAGELLSCGEYEGVRVVEERLGDDEEYVIFEEFTEVKEKPLRIVPVSESPVCTKISDYYKYPARKTTGRLIRAFLDKHGLCALELLYDAGYLSYLERMDTYYYGAVRHVAGLQAKLGDEKSDVRADALYKAFSRIRENARDIEAFRPYAKVLAEKGLDAGLKAVAKDVSAESLELYIYGMLAIYLDQGSWAGKLAVLLDLIENAENQDAITYIDEIIAEILDGKQALEDIFGAPPSPVNAWREFIHVAFGRYKAPKYATEEVQQLSNAFARHNLPLSRGVLLDRVAKGLRGTAPLSREGRETDREKFVTLVREIIEPIGIVGGPDMCEAVVLRAKILLSEDENDLPIDTAMRQVLYLLPNNAARLGVMLDLTSTSIGIKYEKALRIQLAHLISKLQSVLDLFPASVDEMRRLDYLDALRQRVGLSSLPEDLKDSFAASLNKFSARKGNDPVAASEQKLYPAKKKQTNVNGKTVYAPGEIVFTEGDSASVAYLVIEGAVEILKNRSDGEYLLSTLGVGEIFGEMSLIDNQPRMASARAVGAVKVACISQNDLSNRIGKLKQDDKVMYHVMRTLVRRLRGFAHNGE